MDEMCVGFGKEEAVDKPCVSDWNKSLQDKGRSRLGEKVQSFLSF